MDLWANVSKLGLTYCFPIAFLCLRGAEKLRQKGIPRNEKEITGDRQRPDPKKKDNHGAFKTRRPGFRKNKSVFSPAFPIPENEQQRKRREKREGRLQSGEFVAQLAPKEEKTFLESPPRKEEEERGRGGGSYGFGRTSPSIFFKAAHTGIRAH